MSENVIYCFSGTGNCLDMAKNIARELGDTDVVSMRSFPAVTDASAYRRVGFVFPCYGGGLPGNVEQYVRSIHIGPDAYKFAVVQYAGYPGCGLGIIDDIVGLDYYNGVSHQSTCIWLMSHTMMLPPMPAKAAQKRSEKKAQEIARDVKAMKRSGKKPPKNGVFAAESAMFGKIVPAKAEKYTVSDDCIGCGQCVKLCPKDNIRLENGRAVIGMNCIGCLGCVQYCPQKAINVGKVTLKRERYHNVNVSAEELTRKIIHID